MLIPQTTHSAIEPKTQGIRLYSQPMWVQPNGHKWDLISNVVHTSYSEGRFVISLDGEWISLTPLNKNDLVPHIKSVMSEGHHFGYLLDKGILTNSLGWRIEHSNKVTQISSGEWLLREINGIKLGLSIQDWLRGFGKDCIINNEIVTLDISKRKGKDIDLDPFIVIAIKDDWAIFNSNSHSNEEADGADQTGIYLKAEAYDFTIDLSFKRSCIRFDTSSYSGPLSAVLWGREASTAVTGIEEEIEVIACVKCELEADIAAVGNYGAIRDGLDTGGFAGKFSEADGDGGWATRDMTPQFVAQNTFDVGFMHEDDSPVAPPASPNTAALWAPAGGDNDPYLLITMPDILRYKYNNGVVDRFRRENLSGQYYKI